MHTQDLGISFGHRNRGTQVFFQPFSLTDAQSGLGADDQGVHLARRLVVLSGKVKGLLGESAGELGFAGHQLLWKTDRFILLPIQNPPNCTAKSGENGPITTETEQLRR